LALAGLKHSVIMLVVSSDY